MPATVHTVTLDDIRHALPRRPADANKSTFGRVLLVCGSDRMRGCAALATYGALRTGAGLVTLSSTRAVIDTVAPAVFEATFLDRDAEDMFAAAKRMQAIGYGCGLGLTPRTTEDLLALMSGEGAPLVIDADGLTALAAQPTALKKAGRPVILTPHPLEFSRLCGRSVADIQADRVGAARAFAADAFSPTCGGVLLLKGAGTIITDGVTVLCNPTGSTAPPRAAPATRFAACSAPFSPRGQSRLMRRCLPPISMGWRESAPPRSTPTTACWRGMSPTLPRRCSANSRPCRRYPRPCDNSIDSMDRMISRKQADFRKGVCHAV